MVEHDVKPKVVERYGKMVWESRFDAIRHGNCLCHQCAHMKPGETGHCKIASAFYDICKQHGNAFILTRCDSWSEK